LSLHRPPTWALHPSSPNVPKSLNPFTSVDTIRGHYSLVSWTYNLGEGALRSSTLLKKVNTGRHGDVPGQMKRWNKAGGRVLKGLERRREAEAALYEMRWY
jgi:GH24 family phage-related lysozyme (muramidase)